MVPAEQSTCGRYCPLTRKPCEQGDCSNCSRFWDCIQKAMDAGRGSYISHSESGEANEDRKEGRE